MTSNTAPFDPWPSIGQFLANLRPSPDGESGRATAWSLDDGEWSSDFDELGDGTEH